MVERFVGVKKQSNGMWMSYFYHGNDIKVIATTDEKWEELAAFELTVAVDEFDQTHPGVLIYFASKAVRKAASQAQRERDHTEARTRMLNRKKFVKDTIKALKAPNHIHNMNEIALQFKKRT